MLNKVDRYKTESIIKDYSEEILEMYSNSVGEFSITKEEEDFVRNIAFNCAGLFSDKDIFDILKLLRIKNLMTPEILSKSKINIAFQSVDNVVSENIKSELLDLSSNIQVKHISENDFVMSEYITECLTIPSLADKLKIGEMVSTIKYKNNGGGVETKVSKDEPSNIDFSINNLFILHKKEYLNGSLTEFVNIIIVPKFKHK